MIIKDINNNERNVKDIKEVSCSRSKPYIQVTVIGKTSREWVEWYPLEVFMELNPGVVV